MDKNSYSVSNIEGYPWDGKHQQVIWDLPIKVVKGVDTFMYYDSKGKERWYNKRALGTSPIDQRWFAYVDRTFHMTSLDSEDINRMLSKVVHKDISKVLKHCIKVWKKVMRTELEYLNRPLVDDTIEINQEVRFSSEFKIN